MSLPKSFATSSRVLKQLRHDPRTVGLIILVPILLIVILKYAFEKQPQTFNHVVPIMLGIFPLVIMFLVTSIATLRERTSGTLDRLMTQPISKFDFISGYARAFSIVGLIQACAVSLVTLGLLGVTVLGGAIPVLVTAIITAFLGTSLGLLVSAFARNEFQAVQMVMPIIMPQILLCGLFVPREDMAGWLQKISDVLPLTYAVDAMQQVAMHANWTHQLTTDLLIVLAFGIAALLLGSVTIRRQE